MPSVASSSAGRALSTNTLTFSHTVPSGSDRHLVVLCNISSAITTITGTYGGVSLTKTNDVDCAAGTSGPGRLVVFELASPTVGTANVVLTANAGSFTLCASASTLTECGSLGLLSTAEGSSTAPSITVSSKVGALVLDVVGSGGIASINFTPGPGQTSITEQDGLTGTNRRLSTSRESGATSVTMSWTLSATGVWIIGALSVYPKLAKYCSNPQLVAPASAAPASITPSGTAWANSAWVEVIASTSAAIVVTGIQPITLGAAAIAFEFDVGVGAIGAETVVTTFRGSVGGLEEYLDKCLFPLVIPTDNIPTLSRVALRLRKGGTSVVPWTLTLLYWNKPLVGAVLTSAQPQKCVPPAANNIALTTSGTAWANSAYTTVIASVSVSMVITGIVLPVFSAGTKCEVDLAIGAAGAEVVITTMRIDNTGTIVDAGFCYPLWNPLDAVPAGARLAARVRMTSTTGNPTLALVYVEKPL